MRIQVYSQEITSDVRLVCKTANTGKTYWGVRFFLHSPEQLHHTPDDDDRSAVTFWLSQNPVRLEAFAQELDRMAAQIRALPK